MCVCVCVVVWLCVHKDASRIYMLLGYMLSHATYSSPWSRTDTNVGILRIRMLCKILRIEEKVGGTHARTQHAACEVDPESSQEDHDHK